jgi:hypothetical protein
MQFHQQVIRAADMARELAVQMNDPDILPDIAVLE